uniref:Galectin n=1 Tax=Cyprinus carpio TaxID=7962 RepID=A0A8C1T559_CYPCA
MDGAKIWQDFYFLTPGLPTSGQNNPTAGSKQPNRWVGPFLTQHWVIFNPAFFRLFTVFSGGAKKKMNIVSFAPLSSVFSRFQVDLQYVSDIILHFNPRYERGGYVVHNTFQNVGWGSEEWKYENPFPRDHPFALYAFLSVNMISFLETNYKQDKNDLFTNLETFQFTRTTSLLNDLKY